jgi:hypothetical protein
MMKAFGYFIGDLEKIVAALRPSAKTAFSAACRAR